tara:strand:- start:2017 stop:2592 length:576 start_codon:yes stop_codon:yes gene_type:complete
MAWSSDIPPRFAAGTTIKWRDPSAIVPFDITATSSDWTLTYYLRSSVSGAHTIVGSAHNSGWELTISATDSADFNEGRWGWEAIISKGSDKHRIGSGNIDVEQSLSYSGSTPGVIETRTQNEIDRDNIAAALRKFEDGAQEYSIGNRTFKRVEMRDLRVRLSELKAVCFREKQAQLLAQGLGNPRNLAVRF